MRRLVAAFGAVVLIAAMAAAPVGAARPEPSASLSVCTFSLQSGGSSVPMYRITVSWSHFKVAEILYWATNSPTSLGTGVYSVELAHAKSPYGTGVNQSYWTGATYMIAGVTHQERDGTWDVIYTPAVALSSLSACQ